MLTDASLFLSARLRSVLKRIALNSLWLLVARVTSQGLAVIFTVLVARYLGEVGLGQYAFVAAVVFIGNVLATFGVDTILIREVARTRSDSMGEQESHVTAALWIQLALSVILIAVVFSVAEWLPNKTPETILALRLYSLSLVPLAINTTFSANLRAYERMDLILFVNLLSAGVQTAGALILLRAGGGLVALVVFLLAVRTLAALLAMGMSFRWLPDFSFTWQASRSLVQRMLRESYPLAVVTVLMVAYQRLGVLALSLLADDTASGWFAAAVRVTDAFKMLHYAYFGALFPLMSRLAVDDPPPEIGGNPRKVQRDLYQKSFGFLVAFGLVGALMVTILAKPMISLLYGPRYAPSVSALRILIWILVPFAVTSHVFFWLITNGRQMRVLRVVSVTLTGTVLLNLLLIPRFGLIGACLAALGGAVIQASLYAAHAWREMISPTSMLALLAIDEESGDL